MLPGGALLGSPALLYKTFSSFKETTNTTTFRSDFNRDSETDAQLPLLGGLFVCLVVVSCLNVEVLLTLTRRPVAILLPLPS